MEREAERTVGSKGKMAGATLRELMGAVQETRQRISFGTEALYERFLLPSMQKSIRRLSRCKEEKGGDGISLRLAGEINRHMEGLNGAHTDRLEALLWLAKGRLAALEWVLRALDCHSGRPVLVEGRSCRHSIQLLHRLGLPIVSLACGAAAGRDAAAEGMRQIEAQLERLRPVCIYVMPDIHAADGSSWSREWREGLLRLAARSGTPIIEDHPYGGLAWGDGPPESALIAYARAARDDAAQGLCTSANRAGAAWDGVIHIGSWGALDAAGAALGVKAAWMITEKQLLPALADHARGYALPLPRQLALGDALSQLRLEEWLRQLAAFCARRLARTKVLLRRHAPALCWAEPRGGMFLWLQLPAGLPAAALLGEAEQRGVLLALGADFQARPRQDSGGGSSVCEGEGLRLNYCETSEEQLEEGVRRLGQAVAVFTARS